jgi:hypothetical protein
MLIFKKYITSRTGHDLSLRYADLGENASLIP